MKNYMSIFALAFLFSTSIFAQKDKIEYGLAAIYGDRFDGKPTASGIFYDMDKMTAAHRSLPFGTEIKVTRLDNKKSVNVVVNDRGPLVSEVVVDLSKAAARKLDLLNIGKANVKVEIVKLAGDDTVASKPAPKETKREVPTSMEEETAAIETPKTTEKKAEEKKPEPREKEAVAEVKKPEPKKVTEKSIPVTSKATLVTDKDFQPYDLFKIELKRPEKKGFGVQVASFSQYEGVFKQIAELQGEWFKNILMKVEKGEDGKTIYKIILGPFDDQDSANAYKDSLAKKKIKGFVVNLEEQ